VRRLAGVFDAAISFASLLAAYRRARRGHRRSAQVLAFALELERELLALRTQLGDGSYRPGAYRQFVVYERKPRLISAAPFRDRVVHHAAMAAIEPALDRRFIAHSYACRRGRGTHAAVERYQQWARRYRYVLKLDVAAYFPSIDHEILKAKLARRIGDRRMLALLGVIIDASPPSPPPAPACDRAMTC
jgi:retron-type reverse transcriptase